MLVCAQLIKQFTCRYSKHAPAPSTVDSNFDPTVPPFLNVPEAPIPISNSDSESSPQGTVFKQMSYDLDLQGVVSNLINAICFTLHLRDHPDLGQVSFKALMAAETFLVLFVI